MQSTVAETTHIENELSDLYLACQTNDSEWVKKILRNPRIPSASINGIESNGSTALHIAVELEHADVIKILLFDFGVIRYRLNKNGLTAYQLARNENIRKLFYRPPEDIFSRFVHNLSEQGPVDIDDQSDDIEDNITSQYVSIYPTPVRIAMLHQVISMSKSLSRPSRFRDVALAIARFLAWLKCESPLSLSHEYVVSLCEELRLMIDRFVPSVHCQYKKACDLVEEYLRDNNIDHLLRLYTLPTQFHAHVHEESRSFYNTILSSLEQLQNRYFQEITYRGMVIDEKDLRPYQWAVEHPNCLTVTHSFMSTSIDREVPNFYCDNQTNDDRLSVLMIFNFVELSENAIQLYAIPQAQLSCVSDMEDEQEVLVLPNTIFRIIKIEKNDHSKHHYTIWLHNVPVIRRSYCQTLSLFVHEGFRNVRKKFQR